ncbi:MAG: hypothetical protein HQL82_14250 [Magnetococcales bacterium]|nr:hypothetical protein [Magnetococcales bacterium]
MRIHDRPFGCLWAFALLVGAIVYYMFGYCLPIPAPELVDKFNRSKSDLAVLVDNYKKDLVLYREEGCSALYFKEDRDTVEGWSTCGIPGPKLKWYADLMTKNGILKLQIEGEGSASEHILLAIQLCHADVYYMYSDGPEMPCRKRVYNVDGEIPFDCGEVGPGWQYVVYRDLSVGP